MPRLIYIDTNVYLDYFENRNYGLRPASEFAFSLFRRTISCEFRIVVSDKLLEELKRFVDTEKILDLFDKLRRFDKIVEIKLNRGIKLDASRISKNGLIHYSDALHYSIALNAGAEAIITNDRQFRSLSSGKLPIILPENI